MYQGLDDIGSFRDGDLMEIVLDNALDGTRC